ncbi:hypothetical protein H8S90_23955 [Olivibacter sp. SDN3]|uniref:hypothetical protein n=1 Tax=Olivibacter sp. SDN3 TaxID=2764720 RepID=UPI001651467A|nr:hypothetical protein [Olivibacter sp. SDN3]QNL49727.1 hypothetical protein H8S90_23955 [Olivibacter sp. SDN3]
MKTTELNNNKKAAENIAKNNGHKAVKPQNNLKPSLPRNEENKAQQEKTAETEKISPNPVTDASTSGNATIEAAPKLVKPALNLDSTLKLVEELHRRKIQRDKLISTIDNLKEFEVAQLDDAEETDSNHYQGCELTIEDDKGRDFVTKNPFIVKKVAEYINTLCADRLMEIESEIQFPS